MNNLTKAIPMKQLLSIFIFLICFAMSVPVSAQKTWSLEECIKYALDNNIQIKRQKLQTEISSNTRNQASYEFLPSLTAGSDFSLGAGRSLNTNTYQYANKTKQGDFYIAANYVIFNGFARVYSKEKKEVDYLGSLQTLEKAKNDISLNIANSFLQILYCQELLEVNKSQLDVTLQRVDKTKRLVEAGSSAKGDLLEISAQAAAEKVNVTNAQNNLNISYLILTQLLDLDSVGNFKILTPAEFNSSQLVIPESVVSIYNEAEVKMPQVKQAEFALESSKKSLNLSYSYLYPQLNASASLSTQYDLYAKVNPPTDMSDYAFIDQIKNKYYKQLNLNLSIPIFNKLQTKTQISNAKVNVLDAELAYTQTKLALYKEIQQAHADALAAYDNFLSRQDAVISTEEAFKYSQQKFDVGLISAVDFNIAKNNLTKAKSDLIQAKYQYIFKVKILDFYKGLPVTL